jgi:hypothetical protein
MKKTRIVDRRVYAAGIVDRNYDWAWQGTVVAETKSAALRMLSEFKKKSGIAGRCEVTTFGRASTTHRPVGVSNSTNLF